LALHFPDSVERLSHRARSLAAVEASVQVSGSGCICAGVSAGISGGISGSGSGAISGSGCTCGSVSGGVSGDISSGISGNISGGISGGFSGTVSTSVSTTTTTTTLSRRFKVAGSLEVDVVFESEVTHTEVVDMFKRAIAVALEVPLVNMLEVTASKMEQREGSRRLLQSKENKRYEVGYEAMVPKSMDADAVVARANRIATPGSTESQSFRQIVESVEGIVEVGRIVSKSPAQKVEVDSVVSPTLPESPEEDRSWKSLVVGAIAVLMALLCMTTSAILIRRKRHVGHQELKSEEHDAESGIGQVDGIVLSNVHVASI